MSNEKYINHIKEVTHELLKGGYGVVVPDNDLTITKIIDCIFEGGYSEALLWTSNTTVADKFADRISERLASMDKPMSIDVSLTNLETGEKAALTYRASMSDTNQPVTEDDNHSSDSNASESIFGALHDLATTLMHGDGLLLCHYKAKTLNPLTVSKYTHDYYHGPLALVNVVTTEGKMTVKPEPIDVSVPMRAIYDALRVHNEPDRALEHAMENCELLSANPPLVACSTDGYLLGWSQHVACLKEIHVCASLISKFSHGCASSSIIDRLQLIIARNSKHVAAMGDCNLGAQYLDILKKILSGTQVVELDVIMSKDELVTKLISDGALIGRSITIKGWGLDGAPWTARLSGPAITK